MWTAPWPRRESRRSAIDALREAAGVRYFAELDSVGCPVRVARNTTAAKIPIPTAEPVVKKRTEDLRSVHDGCSEGRPLSSLQRWQLPAPIQIQIRTP
jgi:hypothetical protein